MGHTSYWDSVLQNAQTVSNACTVGFMIFLGTITFNILKKQSGIDYLDYFLKPELAGPGSDELKTLYQVNQLS